MITWESEPQALGAGRWAFPPAAEWPDQDVIAIGGDLAPETLVAAYRQGVFPMPLDAPEPMLAWWSPDPRGILPLDRLRVTRSMKQSAKRYEIRVDTCFTEVMRQCADPARPSGWITSDFIEAYTALHELGWAHSVEAFDRDGRLAGGLYGVRINGLFAGESMFALGRDASKVALMALVRLMTGSGLTLLDVQWQSDHLASLGAIEVPRRDYLSLLVRALQTVTHAQSVWR